VFSGAVLSWSSTAHAHNTVLPKQAVKCGLLCGNRLSHTGSQSLPRDGPKHPGKLLCTAYQHQHVLGDTLSKHSLDTSHPMLQPWGNSCRSLKSSTQSRLCSNRLGRVFGAGSEQGEGEGGSRGGAPGVLCHRQLVRAAGTSPSASPHPKAPPDTSQNMKRLQRERGLEGGVGGPAQRSAGGR